MKAVLVFLFIVLNAHSLAHASSIREEISTEHGKVPALIDRPEGAGPFPLLIIAPAKGYLMKERLFEKLAIEAKEAGFLSVRFDWGFSQKGGDPSKDYKDEASEIESVTRHFLKRGDVNESKVILAAKSMGSKAAMKSSLAYYWALLLLTPNCDQANTFRKLYAPIFSARKPVQITISRTDPYCEIEQIYEAAKDLTQTLSIHTLEGDHNFVDEKSPNKFSNQDAAVESSVNWLKNQINH